MCECTCPHMYIYQTILIYFISNIDRFSGFRARRQTALNQNLFLYIHTYIYAYAYILIQIFKHRSNPWILCTQARWLRTNVCVRMYIHINTYAYKYIRTDTYTDISFLTQIKYVDFVHASKMARYIYLSIYIYTYAYLYIYIHICLYTVALFHPMKYLDFVHAGKISHSRHLSI